MMRPRISRAVSVGVATATILTVITGCAQSPVEQLEAAQKAVESARNAEAAVYARDDLAKLEQKYLWAKEEVAAQEKVLSMFQSFSDAEELLDTVIQDSRQVAANAARNKETAKTAALDIEQETKQVVASTKKSMSNTPLRKEEASRKVLEREFMELEMRLSEVHRLIKKGDYLSVQAQSEALKEKCATLSAAINAYRGHIKSYERES